MDMQSNEHEAAANARTMNARFRVLAIIGSVILVLIVAAIWIPHNMVSRVAHDESSAVYGLRGLTSLETHYATAHPSKGFTCDFTLLKREVPSNQDPTHEGFLFSDPFEGYKFSLTGCEANSEGVVSDIRQPQYLCCPAKRDFVLSAQTKQANFAMPRMVLQRVAINRWTRRSLISANRTSKVILYMSGHPTYRGLCQFSPNDYSEM